jgi:ParB family transcriptional regulator, chromosome partitioning protein
MTTAAAGHSGEKEKDKVEKRRALGRGLESLLPGPRVVAGTAARPAGTPAVGGDSATAELRSAGQPRAAVPTSPSGIGGGAGTRAEPALSLPKGVPAPHRPEGEPFGGVIRAEVEEAVQSPEAASSVAGAVAELRSAWPDQRSGPTQSHPTPSGGTPSGPTQFGSTQSTETITILAQAESRAPGNLVVNLAIADIDKNPFQTRYVHNGEALEELTNSIKANGVLQPILVRPAAEEGRYILILGERRMHAAKLAGQTTVPAMVRRVSEQQAAEMTIIENLQREDLSPLEQAEAFRVLSEEFKLTQAQIGERVGLSRESVANYMRLLRLPREVMQLLAEKRIKFSEAKELLKLEDNDKITQAALYAVKKGMNIEQIEMLVMRMEGVLDPLPGMPGQEKKKRSGARWVDPNVRAAQMELERLLGVRVRIRDRKGKGKIVIEYSTVDDYERVVGMLRGK